LVICSPNRHEEANEIVENPKRAKELYEQRFVAVLDKTINDLLRESSRESSPILESMKTAAIVSVGPSERQQIPFRMTIISDMIQNTAPIRQFNSEANFQQLARSPAWTSLRPSLFGMYQTSPDP
jgi:hypothetical protein